jgi:hypothetical protein
LFSIDETDQLAIIKVDEEREPKNKESAMTRMSLDLRDKTLTELIEMDQEIGSQLDEHDWHPETGLEEILLADRCQIRAQMESLKTQTAK